MSLAIRVTRHGGPEVLEAIDETVPPPGPGEVRIRQTAIGLNFIDTYFRAGVYQAPLPHGLGQEAAGVVEALGPGVEDVRVGDRVAYGTGPLGAYAEVRNFAADRLVQVPHEISDEVAAAVLLKGMTAWYLLRQTHVVQAGETLLVHAAAGGVGSLLVPWAKALGARVIGTVGSFAKSETALALGCDEVILYREQDVARAVRKLTGGRGVDVVYDSIGRDTFAASLDSLKPRGLFVSFGNASGKAAPFEPVLLAEKGSLYFTRPTLAHYTATRAELESAADALFDLIERGVITPTIAQRWPLREAAAAHAALESRQTTGASVLLP
jgi:NADPH2:quinone reductase